MELYNLGTRVGCLIFSFIIYIIGTTGNLLIIWTIAKVKHMRTVQNLMVALLASIDLLISGYILPFSMHVLITNREPERLFCKFQASMTAFLFCSSIQFIMLIATVRYIKICHSQKYNSICKVKTILLATIVPCTVSATIALTIWISDELWSFERNVHTCIFNRYGNKVFSIVLATTLVAVPIWVTGFCYIQIYRFVKKANIELYKHWNNGLARRKLKYETMISKSQFVVFIAYTFLYIPIGITFVGLNSSDFPDSMHTVAMYMCYLNSSINCVLYGLLNTNMRKAYFESLSCVIQKNNTRVGPTTVSGNMSVKTETPATVMEQ